MSTNYPSSLIILESEKSSATESTPSAVTTPCNGAGEPLDVQVDKGLAAIVSSQTTNGDRSSPCINSLKTDDQDEEESADVKELEDEHISSICCHRNGNAEDSDLNSIFIETSDLQIDLEETIIADGVSRSAPLESPIRFGVGTNTSITSSTNSDLNSGSSENGIELSKLKDLCSRARFARCRARFPVPVILYNQKHICR